ncbi:hypothetical protein [Methylomagnum ishizawai]|uniref:hypothetical protein n=1 Tax=Methylomagnum ishizawai TaxID=1760988 RepID=UPI001C33B4EE|nr:hypothetical protein [Methylomagnum ishizawai]BBL76224.1 hypothetical protein MishRS11D_33220 [Methylomagnum ishizawai]
MVLVPNFVDDPRQARHAAMARLPTESGNDFMAALRTPSERSPLTGLKGLFLRFNQIRVMDNHNAILGVDTPADVYPIILVTSDAADLPYQFQTSRVFNDIKDMDTLPINDPNDGDSGLDVARIVTAGDKTPRFLDIHVVLMKSNEKSRDINKAIHDALESDTGKSLANTLGTAATAANPVAGVIVNAGTALLSLVTGILAGQKDEQIFYGVASYEADPDHLGIGGRKFMTDRKNATVIYEVVGQYR